MFDKVRLSTSQTGRFGTKVGSSAESVKFNIPPSPMKKQTTAKFVTIIDNKSLNSDIRHSFDANSNAN